METFIIGNPVGGLWDLFPYYQQRNLDAAAAICPCCQRPIGFDVPVVMLEWQYGYDLGFNGNHGYSHLFHEVCYKQLGVEGGICEESI